MEFASHLEKGYQNGRTACDWGCPMSAAVCRTPQAQPRPWRDGGQLGNMYNCSTTHGSSSSLLASACSQSPEVRLHALIITIAQLLPARPARATQTGTSSDRIEVVKTTRMKRSLMSILSYGQGGSRDARDQHIPCIAIQIDGAAQCIGSRQSCS